VCGICGFYRIDDPARAPAILQAMTDALQHRGPDGQATWLHEAAGVGLGHTRLAIIDLAGGAQPMPSGDGRFVITFNGEIYNFQAVRQELEGLGHTFRTRSDTEVLLEAYRRWGRACLERLHGMFAFALYDSVERRLFLARDRTGIKPLYYACLAGGFYFGSELKAILAAPNIPRRLNYRALADFLVLSYPLLPETFFAGIQELEPGTWMEVSNEGTRTGRFWAWQREPKIQEAGEALRSAEQAITQSLREHLIADVPIGAFLSGGIDSSLLVALLVKALGQQIETFNVRFTEAEYDESPYARKVAECLGTQHHEIVLETAEADIGLVDDVLRQFDQPFGDSSAIPTYLICRKIRQSMKVAIAGDGGDEMFGGYPRFRHAETARQLGRLPGWCLQAARSAAGGIAPFAPDLARQAHRMLRAASAHDEERLMVLSCYEFPDNLGEIFLPAVMERIGSYVPAFLRDGAPACDAGGGEFIDATVRYVLPGDYLRKVDVMSSAHGLEVRVPLLGEAVLDCAARIPERFKYSRQGNKLLLRALAARYLPDEIAAKPKAGFGIPLDTWLGAQGRKEIQATLIAPNAHIRELVRPDYVQMLTSGFATQEWGRAQLSRYNLYQHIYMLWSLERWLAQWKPCL